MLTRDIYRGWRDRENDPWPSRFSYLASVRTLQILRLQRSDHTDLAIEVGLGLNSARPRSPMEVCRRTEGQNASILWVPKSVIRRSEQGLFSTSLRQQQCGKSGSTAWEMPRICTTFTQVNRVLSVAHSVMSRDIADTANPREPSSSGVFASSGTRLRCRWSFLRGTHLPRK